MKIFSQNYYQIEIYFRLVLINVDSLYIANGYICGHRLIRVQHCNIIHQIHFYFQVSYDELLSLLGVLSHVIFQ